MANKYKCLCCVLGFVIASLLCFSAAGGVPSSGDDATETAAGATGVWTPPHLVPHKDATPKDIYLDGTNEKPDTTTVTLTVKAEGDPTLAHVPTDVVLAIDSSGSMAWDFGGRQKMEYVKEYSIGFLGLLNLSGNDRAAVVQLNGTADGSAAYVNLLQGYTNDTAIITSAINSMVPSGSTRLYDACVESVDYANNNHWPPAQTHPHMGISTPKGHHQPAIILLTDGQDTSSQKNTFRTCIDFVANSYNEPPPANYRGFGTKVFTIGMGTDCDMSVLDPIAEAGGGKSYFAPTPEDLIRIYKEITDELRNNIAALQASPTESMIGEILPPYLTYQGGWYVTDNNTATICSFKYEQGLGNLWGLYWNVPRMEITDVFEVQYNLKTSREGWQSIGVTSYNATTNYSSDYCKVKYLNWRYTETLDAGDIWSNETNDVSIIGRNVTSWIIDIVTPPPPPPPAPPPPGMPVLAPLEIPISMFVEVPMTIPAGNLAINSMVQPQLMLNTMLQPMMNPVNMPNFVGLVAALGMVEKIRVRRKMRGMRIAVSDKESASERNLKLGE